MNLFFFFLVNLVYLVIMVRAVIKKALLLLGRPATNFAQKYQYQIEL